MHWRTLSQVYAAWCTSRRLYPVDEPQLRETIRRRMRTVQFKRLRIDSVQLRGVMGLPWGSQPDEPAAAPTEEFF